MHFKNIFCRSSVVFEVTPMGSRTQARAFLKPVSDAKLHLPDVMVEAVDDIDNLSSYETLSFNEYHEKF